MQEGRQAADTVSRHFCFAPIRIEYERGEICGRIANGRLKKENAVGPHPAMPVADPSRERAQGAFVAFLSADVRDQEVVAESMKLGKLHTIEPKILAELFQII